MCTNSELKRCVDGLSINLKEHSQKIERIDRDIVRLSTTVKVTGVLIGGVITLAIAILQFLK